MIYIFGDCTFDTTVYTLQRGGKQTRLRPKVFQVLEYLLTHRDRVVSKQDLRDTVWPDQFVGDEALESTVSAVRKAIGDSGRAQRWIQTLSGHGYRFVGSVETRDETPADDVAPVLQTPAPQAPVPQMPAPQPPVPQTPAPPRPSKPSSIPRRMTPEPRRERPSTLGRDRGARPRRPPASPFIGRSMYLSWCEYAIQDALIGRPTALFLQGEAGMGKTRLIKELRDMATRSGLQLFVGRCSEGLALPYMPFINALREPWLQLAPALEPNLGADAAIINRWLQLDDKLGLAANAPLGDEGEQAKLRLFLAVARTLTLMAKRQPMLFVIDDMHWVDAVSLELYAHLVFTVADMAQSEAVPLLLIGTHRPVPPQDRLARSLARFQREEICESLELEGLEEAEVHLFLEGNGLGRASQQLVHTLHETTSGNPLFIQELIQYLQQRNALHVQAGYLMTTASASELRLPDQVTSAILTNVESLSPDCRQTLIAAALLGDEFSIDILSTVEGVGEEVVLNRLEEALHQGILLSEGQTFQFAHPLMQQVLYNLPSVAQRQRLHWQIAQTLERLGYSEHREQVLQLAHHLVRSGSVADADKVVQYTRQAGDYAFTQLDWQGASTYYKTALNTETSQALPTSDLADLHYRVGIAYARDGNISLSDTHHDYAITAYESLGDMQGQTRALVEKMLRKVSVSYGELLDVEPLENLLETLGNDEPKLRSSLAMTLSQIYWAARYHDQAERYAQYSFTLAEQLEDYTLCARARFSLGLAQSQDLRLNTALEQYEQARAYARRANNLGLEGTVLQRVGPSLVMAGRFDEVRAIAEEAYEVTSKINNWWHYGLTFAALASLSVATGAFTSAAHYTQEAMKSVSRYRFAFGGVLALPALACAHALRGARQEAEGALDTLVEPGRVFDRPPPAFLTLTKVYRQLIQLYVAETANPIDITAVLNDIELPEHCDVTSLFLVCALVELTADDPKSAIPAKYYPKLLAVVEQGVKFTRGWVIFLPRILGLAAAQQQRWDQAQAHFRDAIVVATDIDARPDLGRTYLDYARMLCLRDVPNHRSLARDILRKARLILHDLEMVPFVRQVDQFMEVLDQ